MATIEQLSAALRAADASGDFEDARVLATALKQAMQAKPSAADKYDPTEGMAWWQKGLAGVGKSMSDAVNGVKSIGAMVGVGDQDAIQAEIDATKKRDAALMDTGMGMAGKIAGDIGMALVPAGAAGVAAKGASMLPGLARAAPALATTARALSAPTTVKGAAALGGAMGALQPVASDESRLSNIGMGVLGGGIGQAAPKMLAGVLKPNLRPELDALVRENVSLTPGQIAGGFANRLEQGATSIPIVGDAIKAARRRSFESFDVAALNQALRPLGVALPKKMKAGGAAVEHVAEKIGEAYDNVLPHMPVTMDKDFWTDMQRVYSSIAKLPKEQSAQAAKLIDDHLVSRFSGNSNLAGKAMKQADSELGRLARGYGKDPAFDNREMAAVLRETRDALRSMVARQNPQLAPKLKAADEAYATFLRVQDAAGRIGAHDGIFSPAQLRSAVRAQDSSMRKSQFSRGNALMQKFADSGESVLGSTVPDSGSPYRGAMMLGAGTGALALKPELLAGALAGAGMYSSPVQWAMQKALTARPDAAGLLSDPIRKFGQSVGPYLAAPMSLGLLNYSGQ